MPDTNAGSPTIVIFGASGDLTQRKLIPALFSQYRKKRLPAGTRIVGFARRPYSQDDFRKILRDGMTQFAAKQFDAAAWDKFAANIWYARGDLNTPADFEALHKFLNDLEKGPANRLYYLATSPEYYAPIATNLGAAGLAKEDNGWRRIIIEKPFGHDLASATELNEAVHAVFKERQVYRIDHYLGKETAQNILFFRFANAIFESVWNRDHIDHVQITVAENVDVGHRAGYYDQAGVLRDMFQNHLLQLLTLVTMEPPTSFQADAIRNEKVKVLTAIRHIPSDHVAANTVRAQYNGYRQAQGVNPDSQTPTFAALRLYIDNWRWQDVPFYLRSGKALKEKTSEIVIQFRRPPHIMFRLPEGTQLPPNTLSLCIQPDEGVHFGFQTKVPDSPQEMRTVEMDFHYRDSFGADAIPDGYERLLLDAMQGDPALFVRSDEIELDWQFIDPIHEGWNSDHAPKLASYESGSWGPLEADVLLNQDGRNWLAGCGDHDGKSE